MMESSIVATKGTRAWQGIPAIERAPNGRLWCAFYSGGPKEPHPDNHILLTTSGDDGATWREPTVVVDPQGSARAYDPTLWHNPTGRLWLIYNRADLERRSFSVWARTTENADAPAPEWSAPRRIDLGVPFAFRMNKPIVLSDGAWLLPVTWARSAPAGWFAHGDQLQGVARSTDHGATWTLHGAVEAPAWALENMVVAGQPGRLWMLIRTGAGVLWESFSEDGGRSWTQGAPTEIVNPGTRFYIGRLASGRLLLINTFDPETRTGLDACFGLPEKMPRFNQCRWLDAREQVSYPDAVQAPDGRIFIVYDRDRYGVGEINLRVIVDPEA
jgi:predicted neuraminidase